MVIPCAIGVLIVFLPVAVMAGRVDSGACPADSIYEEIVLSDRSPGIKMTGPASRGQAKHWGLSRTHRYLGYATAIAGLVAGVSSSSESFHKASGFTTAGLAAATWSTGVIQYSGLIDLSKGITTYNMHAALTTLATIGFIITVSRGNADNSHGSVGVASEAATVIPIVIMRW